MQVRLETLSISDEQRRAIRFALAKRRTPATRDEVRQYLEGVVNRAIAEAEFRWNGKDNATVDTELANDISENKASADQDLPA